MSLEIFEAVSQQLCSGIIYRAAPKKWSNALYFICAFACWIASAETYSSIIVCIEAKSDGILLTLQFRKSRHVLLIACFWALSRFVSNRSCINKSTPCSVCSSALKFHYCCVFECNKNWRAITPYLHVWLLEAGVTKNCLIIWKITSLWF